MAVALRDIAAGEQVSVGHRSDRLPGPIPSGHKFALDAIPRGAAVTRYGERIDIATADIEAGSHVHSHNLATALSGERNYSAAPRTKAAPLAAPLPEWQGYRRADGRFATRNEIWLLPTVGCVAPLVEDVAREARRDMGKVDAIVGFGHPHGCSQLGDDLAGTRAVLAALCDNPNAGGVVLVGLGCESNQLDALIPLVPERVPGKIRMMRAQQPGDEFGQRIRWSTSLPRSWQCSARKPQRRLWLLVSNAAVPTHFPA